MTAEPSRGDRVPVSPQAIDDARVIETLETYLAALAVGAGIDRRVLLARHPAVAAEVGACLDMIDLIHQVASEIGVTPGSQT